MTEYIDRAKVHEAIKNICIGAVDDGRRSFDVVAANVEFRNAVDCIPAADVTEVRHGEWLPDYENLNNDYLITSILILTYPMINILIMTTRLQTSA